MFQVKKIDDVMASASTPSSPGMRRTLRSWDVALLGIGAIIGGGIFATLGTAALGDATRAGAGPSVMLSFLVTALVCGFTAMSYAELASMVPVSGSAYTYVYAALGELLAWVIGWDLILEYAVSNVAVAISWAHYFRSLLRSMGLDIPFWLAMDYPSASRVPGLIAQAPQIGGIPVVINLVAFSITAFLTFLLMRGMRASSQLNNLLVLFKIAILLFFGVAACMWVSPSSMVAHWQPFFPNGFRGTFNGAAVVFFAYIGFDSISTVAEETHAPSRTIPIGIITSLLACALLYVGVAAVFTGLMPWDPWHIAQAQNSHEPLTWIMQQAAPSAPWIARIMALGAVVAQTTALLAFQMAQARVFFAMARDGLLPAALGHIHPRFKTPYTATLLAGLAVGIVSAMANLEAMVDLTNIGTLFAFLLVCAGVPILRWREPDRPRAFRVPAGAWFFPSLGALSCLFLMIYVPAAAWWQFLGWLTLGLSCYAAYGYTHSRLGRHLQPFRQNAPGFALGSLLISIGLFAMPSHLSWERFWGKRFWGGHLWGGHLWERWGDGWGGGACSIGLIASGCLMVGISGMRAKYKTQAQP